MFLESVFMTCTANNCLLTFQKQLSVAGMGIMTIYTAISRPVRQVAVCGIEFAFDLSMTLQALSLADNFTCSTMARTTTLGKWLMLYITNQCFLIAAMGIMTGKTSLNLNWVPFMVVLNLSIRVT